MKVAILGGGVMGVTTAWYLAKDGHEVVVLDRHGSVAQETSFANAGYIAPGHCYAWASPRAPIILLQSLTRDDAAIRWRLKADPRMWAWGLRFLANCTAARNRTNTLVKLRLCLHSQHELKALREELGISYDETVRGVLYLYRDAAHLETAAANAALLRDNGLAMETIEPAKCAEIEPVLASSQDRFAGAIFCPSDESGDCRLFTERMMEQAQALGAVFQADTDISGLRAEGDRVTAAETSAGPVTADAFVLALGSYSPFVSGTVGVKLPIYPAKGYSMTIPVAGRNGAPAVPVLDEHSLIAFSRFGDRFRATATAEFSGYDQSFQPRDFAPMRRVAQNLFPEAGDYERPDYWACLRPMTPDGPPVLGRGRHDNLWYNTGHGHIGWTMACGSARITADLIAGRDAGYDLAGTEVGRF
ncbi:MAG: D-amino acid dehydrogenase [Alphaproteobacteria bacterium]|nr:D-amino acid dehydrogenase [Alphaproteobacteria bacterium]